jgi:hypothetical protein
MRIYLYFACGLIFGCRALCEEEWHPIFEDINFGVEHVDIWLKTNSDGTLTWGPVSLEADKDYANIVQSLRWIAMHGKYFETSLISDEITNQIDQGKYASLLGWTQALNGTPQSEDLLNVLLDALLKQPNKNTSSVIGYCFLTLLDSSLRKGQLNEADVENFSAKIRLIKAPISLHELSNKSFQEWFFASIAKLHNLPNK